MAAWCSSDLGQLALLGAAANLAACFCASCGGAAGTLPCFWQVLQLQTAAVWCSEDASRLALPEAAAEFVA